MYVCRNFCLSLEERASTFQVFGFLIHSLGPKLSSDILRLHVACVSVRFWHGTGFDLYNLSIQLLILHILLNLIYKGYVLTILIFIRADRFEFLKSKTIIQIYVEFIYINIWWLLDAFFYEEKRWVETWYSADVVSFFLENQHS